MYAPRTAKKIAPNMHFVPKWEFGLAFLVVQRRRELKKNYSVPNSRTTYDSLHHTYTSTNHKYVHCVLITGWRPMNCIGHLFPCTHAQSNWRNISRLASTSFFVVPRGVIRSSHQPLLFYFLCFVDRCLLGVLSLAAVKGCAGGGGVVERERMSTVSCVVFAFGGWLCEWEIFRSGLNLPPTGPFFPALNFFFIPTFPLHHENLLVMCRLKKTYCDLVSFLSWLDFFSRANRYICLVCVELCPNTSNVF